MNLRRLAVAVMAIACLAACIVSTKAAAPAKGAAAQDVSALPACRPGDDPLKLLAPAKLTGPAAGSVTANRVTKAWSVDGGKLRVSPAAVGSKPTVPMQQAACNLLAAITGDGFSPSGLGPVPALGSTFGYGRLSVSARLPQPASYVTGAQITTAPPIFENRPAWILTTVTPAPACACAVMWSTPSPTPTQLSSWDYRVFAVDATTGRASITYIEAGSQGGVSEDPASSAVPYEEISVPWRLGSVSADRSSGQIQIQAPACEVVWLNGFVLDSVAPQVQVAVKRALGPACGPDIWNTVDLYPAMDSRLIPPHLTHAAVGPFDLPAA